MASKAAREAAEQIAHSAVDAITATIHRTPEERESLRRAWVEATDDWADFIDAALDAERKAGDEMVRAIEQSVECHSEPPGKCADCVDALTMALAAYRAARSEQ